jgi:uncharacterized protein (DUF305 family)
MRTKQFLLGTALAAVIAATGARAQEAGQSNQHQQHHPAGAQAATPDQQGGESAVPAIPGQGTGAAPQTGSESGMGMMGSGMMRMMRGGGPMMMQTPAPGVTIIINMQGTPMMQGPMGAGETDQGPAARAYEEAMDSMRRGMAVTPSGDADVDFARMMIPHHQGAIDMAQVELAQGKDPKLRAMAQDIIKAQEGEIATLKDWLSTHPR